jgi:hypothetical protein
MRTSTATAGGIRAIGCAILVLLGHASLVLAQCVQAEDVHLCRSIGRDTVVFEATVDRIDFAQLPEQDPTSKAFGATHERLIHLRDVRAVKGVPQDVLVAPVLGSEDCLYQFRQGMRYFIVAASLRDGRLSPSNLTKPIDSSAGLQNYIQLLAQGAGRGQLWGEVLMPSEWIEWSPSDGPVSQARVTVKGPTTRTTVSDARGQYSFANLPWGRYTIGVDLPRDAPYLERLKPQQVELRSDSACAEIVFNAESRSRIDGVILDERGRPASNTFVMLHPADYSNAEAGSPGIGLTTDGLGRYEFSNLPAGRYVVGVNTDIGPTPGSPYREVYASNGVGETVVSLAIGGQLTLEPLKLTRTVPGSVTGVVQNSSGDPVVGVDVSIWWTTARGHTRREYPKKSDGAGRFSFAAWQSVEYWLEVGSHDAPLVRLSAVPLNKPIAVALPDR